VASITNTIATLFIEKLLEHKRFQTSSVLKSFKDQLIASDEELKKSEDTFRKFREENPYLLLSNAGTNIVSSLSRGGSALSKITNKISRLNNLIKQKVGIDFEKKSMVYLELLSFWESENISTGQSSVLTPQYNALLTEKSRLVASNYTPNHPRVLEIESRIKKYQTDIDSRIAQYLQELESARWSIRQNLNSNRDNLKKLPEGELRLAELEQDREVKAQIYSNILIRYNEAKVADASIIPDAFIIDHAEVPIVYSSIFDKLIFFILGPIFGLIIAVGFFILMDYFDFTVKESEEVESRLKLPVLVSIPIILDENEFPSDFHLDKQLDPKLVTSDYAPSIAGEKFRSIRTRLLTEDGNNKKSILISSLTPGDGKSLVSANLAITFAQQKLSTLIIDADLRRGVLHNSLNCFKKPGLADILLSNFSIKREGISRFVQKTHVPYLSLISSGIQVPNPSELLGSERMKNLIDIVEQKYRIVIFDTPPIEYIPDMLVLNSFIHNILFVARYGRTNLNRLTTKLSEISTLKNDFIGIIINAASSFEESDQYSYTYYNY
ncbi:MAG: polysaccharide biosynthesis tyrosine autokinase, partial [Candidatus Hodarchaeales archaeon]